ncbi:cyclodeaminase/cyclohydrolase family protein [Sporomusa sphaeroides]|uniref:Methenyltetrahydrofolate cyclohydrolase n=2 Tax=Sporomusa TaxID=2375 RepID=A0ABM9W358_9FIRM|nr:cyclodeaminase/cyclohydrolase family protein [Sporomusa sphaeroides]OLS56799.1 methenyltetrahydrofolate cyclohydrolase [Sporomusa sphaeroides DSM 2875]CVK18746.1 Methenyltetrahydrofolate cyclohydrolase [Sporomusa sphaeroides DSM 2875]SCM81936.1 Methenyltetrahydrofolate cyclohydrolase [uncultured Sporomusa sp.]
MLIQMKITDFLEELGSNSPAPGGGSISALAGALGGALTAMVCRLTVDNSKYAEVQSEIQAILAEADRLSAKLTNCVDADTEAFNQVMAAYKLPKATDAEKTARSEAIQKAMQHAADLPLGVAECCLRVLEMSGRVLKIGNANAASDAAVAGLMAHAGLHGALYNVKINLGSIKDEKFVANTQTKVSAIIEEDKVLHQELLATASQVIG